MTIKVEEYHNLPLEELAFPDGTIWKVRQPNREEDIWAYQAIATEHDKRVKAHGATIAALALTAAADEEARITASDVLNEWRAEERAELVKDNDQWTEDLLAQAVEKRVRARVLDSGDEIGRQVLAARSAEPAQPLECTNRYLNACQVALFVVPEQTPEKLLEMLGAEILAVVNLQIIGAIHARAAKNRMRASGTS